MGLYADENAPGALEWTFHHERMTFDALGYIPNWLNSQNEAKAAEQIDKGYPFGGWQPFSTGKIGEYYRWQFSMDKDHALTYPGDPPLPPFASAKLRDETICFYQHAWVAIVQADGSFEVCRLD